MQLEYFHMIDRIVDLNVDEKRIVVEALVPKESTIFEGHFPGYPLMPGVLLIESMAQASGWLQLGVLKFERMPILAAVKEAKVRGSVFPGDLMSIEATLAHEGSGYAMTEAKIRSAASCARIRRSPSRRFPSPMRICAATWTRSPSASAFRNRPFRHD